MLKSGTQVILSLPCKVHCAGFESTTVRLQKQGWELAMEQSFHSDSLRLVMRHGVWKTYAISGRLEYYFLRQFERERELPEFHITYLASQLHIMEHMDMGFVSSIDAIPEIATPTYKNIEDYKLFKTINHSKDIVVDPSDVAALMEHILKIQSPAQADIRMRKRQEVAREAIRYEDIKPAETMHAQIITLVA